MGNKGSFLEIFEHYLWDLRLFWDCCFFLRNILAKFDQNRNFGYVIRHEVKTFLSTNTKSISFYFCSYPWPYDFFFFFIFFFVLLANDSGFPDRAKQRFNKASGSKQLFSVREHVNFYQDFLSLEYFPQLSRYFNYTEIQQVMMFYHSLWKIWCKRTWEKSLSIQERFFGGRGGGGETNRLAFWYLAVINSTAAIPHYIFRVTTRECWNS